MDDTKEDRETVEQSRGQKQEEVQERKEKNSRGDFEEKEGREDREVRNSHESSPFSLETLLSPPSESFCHFGRKLYFPALLFLIIPVLLISYKREKRVLLSFLPQE